MKIFLASAVDIQVIAELIYQIEIYYFDTQASAKEEIKNYVEKNFFQPHCGVQVVLAKEGEEALGIATFSILYPGPDGGGQMYLKDLFTTEASRGKGVGKAIMRFLANFAIEHDCNRLDWTAETDNPKAIEFYHHIGATPVPEKVYFRFSGKNLQSFAKTGIYVLNKDKESC